MDKALDFLKSHRDVAFATVEDGKPKIRVFQIMKQEGTELYFATAPHKEVYKQLQLNPSIELLAMEGDVSVRVVAQASFNVSDAVSREIFDANPVLPRLYTHYNDMVYFKLNISQINYFNLAYTPPQFECFNLG